MLVPSMCPSQGKMPGRMSLTLTYVLVDYNSWVESDKGRRLADSLDKNVVLAEGS